jgi:hypothetical protein
MDLGRVGRHHDPARVHLDQLVLGRERNQWALVDPDRGVAPEDLHIRRPVRDLAFVAEHHLPTFARSRDGSGPSRRPGADHEHVGLEVARSGARDAVRGQPTEADRALDRAFDQRPRPPRMDEALVEEPDRRERVQPIHHQQRVAFDRRPATTPPDAHPVARRRDARRDARHAVDRQQAVRAVPRSAGEAATPMVLQRPGEGPDARPVQRGSNRVALFEGDPLPAEPQPTGRHPSTSFVRVSRVNVHQRRQPRRWNHRSRAVPRRSRGGRPDLSRASGSSASNGRSSLHQTNSVNGRGPQFGHGIESASRTTSGTGPRRLPTGRTAVERGGHGFRLRCLPSFRTACAAP